MRTWEINRIDKEKKRNMTVNQLRFECGKYVKKLEELGVDHNDAKIAVANIMDLGDVYEITERKDCERKGLKQKEES